MLSVIASLLFLAFAVGPGFAGETTLFVSCVEDTSLTPGSTFSVDVSIADVENLWGYQFYLYYDTSVLTVTGFTNNPIFWREEPSEINDAEGYVFIAYHMDYGVQAGFTGSIWLAKIQFTVDDYGGSQLEIRDSILSDQYGNAISHVTTDCHFINVEGIPVASFYWTPETPIEGDTVTFTSTSIDTDGGNIVAFDWNLGDGASGTGEVATHAYATAGTYTVTLTVTDNDGKTDSFTDTIQVLPTPIPTGADLRESKADYRRFDVSVREPEVINTFTAWVKSLNPKEDTVVRIVWSVWEFPGMSPLGSIEAQGVVGPKSLAKFTAGFNVTDPRWKFDGTTRMDYTVRTQVFYCDYYLQPGVPHWALGTVNSVKGTEWFSVTTLP